jgi:chemotaxis protein MotA
MDIATIVGVVLGFALIGLAILVGGSPAAYADPVSVIIVIGGASAAILTSFPLAKVLKLPTVFKKTINPPAGDPATLIDQLVGFAEIARRDGILALENVTDTIQDDFLVKGIQLAVDGTDPELIEQIMTTELENIEGRHLEGKKFFDLLTKYCPAWGMIGTLIGLINMLRAGVDNP